MLERLASKKPALARSRRWFKVVAYITALLFAAILLYSGWKNRTTIQPFIEQADYMQLGGFIAFFLASTVACSINWIAIFSTFDNSLDWWTHTQIYNITTATRRLPGTFWYIGSRVAIYQRLGLSTTVILLANVIELLVTLISASMVGIVFLSLSQSKLSGMAIAIFIISIVTGLLLLRPAVFRWMLQKFGAPPAANLSFRRIVSWVFIYFWVWIASGLMLNQLVSVFNEGSIEQTLYVIGAWALSTTVGMLTFFLPSNFGMTELALTALLSPLLPLPLAGAAAILMRFLTTVLEVSVAVVFYTIALKSPHLAYALDARRNTSEIAQAQPNGESIIEENPDRVGKPGTPS